MVSKLYAILYNAIRVIFTIGVKALGEHNYSRVGEIRSILPKNVNVMALRATASRNTRTDVIRMLGMKHCIVVSRSPHKQNIMLDVKMKPELNAVLLPIVEELKEQGALEKRKIIYCKKYGDVSATPHYNNQITQLVQLQHHKSRLSHSNVPGSVKPVHQTLPHPSYLGRGWGPD